MKLRTVSDMTDYSLSYAMRAAVRYARDDRMNVLVITPAPSLAFGALCDAFPDAGFFPMQTAIRFMNNASVYCRDWSANPETLAALLPAVVILDQLSEGDEPIATATPYNNVRLRHLMYRHVTSED